MAALTVQVVRTLAEADALTDAWRTLANRAASRSITRTPRWMLTWWRVLGAQAGRALRIGVERGAHGELVGLVPLLQRTAWVRGVPVRQLELLATGEDEAEEICSDYVGPLAAVGHEHGVAEGFARALSRGDLGPWDTVVLSALRGDDAMIAPLEGALRSEGLAPTCVVTGESRFVPLPKTWDQYVASLGGERRYVVTRTLRELERWAGGDGFRLVRAADQTSLREGYQILLALHRERWAAEPMGRYEGGAGVFANQRFARFHQLIVPKLQADRREGGISLDWLLVKGRPIAASYNLLFDGALQFYQSGRALEVPSRVRPGIALHALAIRRAIDEGVREYDFLTGDSHYKKQLALASRPVVALQVWNHGRRTAAVVRLDALVRGATPELRRARDAARTLRQRLTRESPH